MKPKPTLKLFEDNSLAFTRSCDQKECLLEGIYKAPRDRAHLHDYYWFCLAHVRFYNEQWNYYEGMSEEEFERERRLEETWQRPTWPFVKGIFHTKSIIHDSFEVFKKIKKDKSFSQPVWPYPRESEENKALILLELKYPFTLRELKVCYINLVKKYHPDANGGAWEAEERLKIINHAYEILKKLK